MTVSELIDDLMLLPQDAKVIMRTLDQKTSDDFTVLEGDDNTVEIYEA